MRIIEANLAAFSAQPKRKYFRRAHQSIGKASAGTPPTMEAEESTTCSAILAPHVDRWVEAHACHVPVCCR